MEIKKISEIFSPELGVASYVDYEFEFISGSELDTLIYTNFGQRRVAPIVSQLVISESPTEEELRKLATMIKNLYKRKWDRLKEVYISDYDALHNYLDEYTEEITFDGSEEGESTKNEIFDYTDTNTGNKTRTDNLSVNTDTENTFTGSEKMDRDVYGFNSDTAINSDDETSTDTSTETGKNVTMHTGTQEIDDSSTETVTGNKDFTINNSNITKSTQNKVATHKGNIGNLTTQQLMKSEIELWKWNFIQSILDDFKDFLTIPVYF